MAETPCSQIGWTSDSAYPNICYLFSSLSSLSFSGAISQCLNSSVNSTLPIFRNKAEYDSYSNVMRNANDATCVSNAWLGLVQSSDSAYVWMDGSPLSFSFWANGQPTGQNNCTSQMYQGGGWSTANSCTSNNYFSICQLRLSETSTTVAATTPSTATNSDNCPNGWVSDNNGICYLQTNATNVWSAAEQDCETLFDGSTLPVLCNSSEMNAFSKLGAFTFYTACDDYYWLGFNDSTGTGNYSWIGSNHDMNISWKSGYPAPSKGACGAFYGWWYNTVINTNCNTRYNYICQLRCDGGCNASATKPKYCLFTSTSSSTTSSATKVATLSTTSQSLACPLNYTFDVNYPTICYQIQPIYYNWTDAIKFCESLPQVATLPIFRDSNEYASYSKLMRSTNTTSCATLTWLGIQSTSNASWAWIDGSPVKFSFWDYNEPTTDNNCTTQLYQGGRWQTMFPCDNIRVTVCQMRLRINFEPTTTALVVKKEDISTRLGRSILDGCPIGWINDTLGTCYFKANMTNPWNTAQQYCQSLYNGSTLPVLCNAQELSAYKEITSTKFYFLCDSKLWIGFNDTSGTGDYRWVKGNEQVTIPWNVGYPACNNGQLCGAENGWWYNNSISNDNCAVAYNFICQLRSDDGCTTNIATSNYCSSLTNSQTSKTASVSTRYVTSASMTNITSTSASTIHIANTSTSTSTSSTPGSTSISNVTQTSPSANVCLTSESFYYTGSVGWLNDTLNNSYFYPQLLLNWQDAEAYCGNIGATLPVFYNKAEIDSFNLILRQYFFQCEETQWLGYRQNVDKSFCSLTGEIPTYFNWYNNSLNGPAPCTACVYNLGWGYNSTWSISNCSRTLNVVCQLRKNANPSIISSKAGCSCINSTSTTSYVTTHTSSYTSAYASSSKNSFVSTQSTLQQFIETSNFDKDTSTAQNVQSTRINALQPSVLLQQLDIGQPTYSGEFIALSSSIQDSIPFLVQNLNNSIKQQIGYSLPQMVIRCTFNNVDCDMDNDFQWLYNPSLGSCYTYNSGLSPKHWTFRAGTMYGLQMLLSSSSQSDYCCSTINAGYKIVIHENNLLPFPDAEGYTIPYGAVSSFSLLQTQMSKLSHPYGVCASSSFGNFIQNYSVEACQRLCFQEELLSTCKCADPRYLLPLNATYCGPEQKACLDYSQMCESDIIQNCDCPEPCNEKDYIPTISTATFIDVDTNDVYCPEDFNSSSTSCSNDFSMLYIYYEQLQQIVYTETASYTVLNMFSDLNGIAGFLLGIGVISVVELILIVVFFTENLIKTLIQ